LLLVFVMLLLSGRRLSFVIEARRMAMACTWTGSEIPLYYFYHDGSDGDTTRRGGKEVDMGQESYGLDSWSQAKIRAKGTLLNSHSAYCATIRLLRDRRHLAQKRCICRSSYEWKITHNKIPHSCKLSQFCCAMWMWVNLTVSTNTATWWCLTKASE
jgi:hypothetical protein